MQAASNTQNKGNSLPEKRVALLWNESFLWGLMAYKALKNASLPFELIRAEDIRNGCLDEYAVLFVPGGWASNKLKALGDSGIGAIRNFVPALPRRTASVSST
jgi:putative intracellular protease/amidase